MSAGSSAPGAIAIFGSGETGKYGRQVQEALLLRYAKPVRVTIVETPAGFQTNVDSVTAKLRTFYEHNLQNAKPVVTIAAARRKGSAHDPDDPAIAALLDDADVIFAGPGSPTYATRMLRDTRTWETMRTRHAAGSTLVFASAAAMAVGAWVLPVYEIFKVGDDPHWQPGLDLLGERGLHVAVVPHWNNAEGGPELDTRCAFVGEERFAALHAMLPADVTVLGIDEHTAVVIDGDEEAMVQGAGTATIVRGDRVEVIAARQTFPLSWLRR
jgi:cyanophycinase-like exopeptidase